MKIGRSGQGHELPDNVMGVDFSSNGKKLLVLSSRRLNAISIVEGANIHCLQFSGEGHRFHVAFSADDRYAFADGIDFVVFDTFKKSLIKKIKGPDSSTWPKTPYFTCFDSFIVNGLVHVIVGCKDGKMFELRELDEMEKEKIARTKEHENAEGSN
ncbi:MAG: hypothetical protein AAF939_17630 [Planctomycetota bacterium]